MKTYIAKDNDRLDEIIYRHYGTLSHFAEILAFNTHLNAILKAGEKVFLPEIKSKNLKSEKALW